LATTSEAVAVVALRAPVPPVATSPPEFSEGFWGCFRFVNPKASPLKSQSYLASSFFQHPLMLKILMLTNSHTQAPPFTTKTPLLFKEEVLYLFGLRLPWYADKITNQLLS